MTVVSDQPTSKFRRLINEAEFVSEWVFAIKTAFTPWLHFDGPKDGTVWLVTDATKIFFKIVHGEIHMIWIWRGVPGITVSMWIEARKNDVSAPEVMASGRDPASGLAEDRRVESCGVFDIRHWHNHTKKAG